MLRYINQIDNNKLSMASIGVAALYDETKEFIV